MSNRKVMIVVLIAGLIKKTLYKMSEYFLNHIEVLEEMLKLNKIYPVMLQRLI